MVWAIVVTLLLLVPSPALAVEEVTQEEWEQIVEEQEQPEQTVPENDTENVTTETQPELESVETSSGIQDVRLQSEQHKEILKELDVLNSTIVTLQTDINNDDDSSKKQVGEVKKEISELKNKVGDILKEIEGKTDTDEIAQLKAISSKLDTIVADAAEPVTEQKPVERNRAGNLVFEVYGNCNPSNQYSTYAKQVIPKMGWNDDYVYFQDSSNSYVLCYGDIDYASAGTFTGTQCKYTRWYYSGSSTGYVVESGVSNVVISDNGHVVLSTLGGFPLLDDGFTLYRQEVCFYAICALVIYCLSKVWNWLIRLRSYPAVDSY